MDSDDDKGFVLALCDDCHKYRMAYVLLYYSIMQGELDFLCAWSASVIGDMLPAVGWSGTWMNGTHDGVIGKGTTEMTQGWSTSLSKNTSRSGIFPFVYWG